MNDEIKTDISRRTIVMIFMLIIILWILSIFLLPIFFGKPENAGVFGDMFGAVNALYSGLAFGGVIVAILLQKNELSLQRIELEQTRLELEGQKLQLEEQNKTMRNQSFENNFFQLLSLYNEIVRTIDMENNPRFLSFHNQQTTSKPPTVGRDVFVRLYNRLSIEIEETINDKAKLNNAINTEELIDNCYMQLYENNKSDLSHYYLTLYNIVKFVDKSSVENKKFYTDILRAQLSSHELLLLYYDTRSIYGKDKFAPLLQTYNLMKHLPKHELLENKIEHYIKEARK